MHRLGLADDEPEESQMFWLFPYVARIAQYLRLFSFVAWGSHETSGDHSFLAER